MGTLSDILKRAETWPKEAQEELEKVARDIENELSGGVYIVNEAERAGIERGLRDIAEGRFVSEAEARKFLDTYRSK
jgi:predicted transcriptional regulator